MVCTLPIDQVPERLALISSLADDALIGGRLHLRDAPGVEARVRELAALESRCCPFLELEIARSDGTIVVDVRPARGRPAADAG